MNKKPNAAPRSLSLNQILARAIIAVVILLLFAGFAFLVTDVYVRTQPHDSSALSDAKPQGTVRSQSKDVNSEEPSDDVNLTFYERLTKEKTYSSENVSGAVSDSHPKPSATPAHEKEVQPPPSVADAHESHPRSQKRTVFYAVQVGSFQSLESAQRLLNELKRKGFSPAITPAHFPEGVTWYRVRVGNSLPRTEAEKVAQKLKQTGEYQPLVVSIK